MISFIDTMLNRITMYRLVLYVLLALVGAAGVLSFMHILPFSPIFLPVSLLFLFAISWMFNTVFSILFEAPANPESVWITALILVLIITPPSAWFDTYYLPLAFWAAAWAVASKYILAIRKKHLFNPAAAGVAITGIFLGMSPSWWVSTTVMAPLVVAGGLLVVRKLRRFDLLWAFLLTFGIGTVVLAVKDGRDVVHALAQSYIYAPAFFLGTIMLTEPLTMPPTRLLRIAYGAIVGFLLLPVIGIGSFLFTPELALIAGNAFAYLVSPKHKLVLRLKKLVQLSPSVFEFVFEKDPSFRFKPGQYLEWTLAHARADTRGIRRYFTIASSPTERDITMAVKFYSPASSYKRALLAMRPGATMVASQLEGEFLLPNDPNKKLVFIAGGIGITPFRSMIQYLLDAGETRPITLVYINRTPEDAVYADVLAQAKTRLGIKTINVCNGANVPVPAGAIAALDEATIRREIPDYLDRTFYLSGPRGMVTAYESLLRAMRVPRRRIKTDYFPGFA